MGGGRDSYINLPAMDRKKAGHYFLFTVFNNKRGRRRRGILYSTRYRQVSLKRKKEWSQ